MSPGSSERLRHGDAEPDPVQRRVSVHARSGSPHVVETFVDLCAEQSMGVRRATMNKWPKTRSAKFEAKKLKGEGLLAGPFTSARSSHNSTHSYLIQLAVNI